MARGLGAEFYLSSTIDHALRYYVEPYCQAVDPAGSDEPVSILAVKQKLHRLLDDMLAGETDYRYTFLLADSGMGMTTSLLAYYARHLNRPNKRFKLQIIPLGIPTADEHIDSIEDKNNTVLFLDGFHEDTLAIVDHVERMRLLLKATRNFRHVLITCRTQFFPKDEEIPRETGIIKVGARTAGTPAEYIFHKIYLSPFTDEQVRDYINRRYPIWQMRRRNEAINITSHIPLLTTRPMLLAHIDDLLISKHTFNYGIELYEEMIEAWLQRERGFIREIESLRQFCALLAVDIYKNRAQRGAERIPHSHLKYLAKQWGIPLEEWQISGRSLLNRDSQGNYKFAHRSIMEYLFVKRFFEGDTECVGIEWTDQMYAFLSEFLVKHFKTRGMLPFHDPTSRLYSMPLGESGARLLSRCVSQSRWLTDVRSTTRRFPFLRMLLELCSIALDIKGTKEVQTTMMRIADNVPAIPLGKLEIEPLETFFEPLMYYGKKYFLGPDAYWRILLNSNKPIVINDVHEYTQPHNRQYQSILSLLNSNSRSCVLIPLGSDGILRGLFVGESCMKEVFDEKYLGEVEELLKFSEIYLR